MLDPYEFADALRAGVIRSGLADGKNAADAGYVSLAGAILDYLKTHLEVTVPGEAFQREHPAPSPLSTLSDVRCRVS